MLRDVVFDQRPHAMGQDLPFVLPCALHLKANRLALVRSPRGLPGSSPPGHRPDGILPALGGEMPAGLPVPVATGVRATRARGKGGRPLDHELMPRIDSLSPTSGYRRTCRIRSLTMCTARRSCRSYPANWSGTKVTLWATARNGKRQDHDNFLRRGQPPAF